MQNVLTLAAADSLPDEAADRAAAIVHAAGHRVTETVRLGGKAIDLFLDAGPSGVAEPPLREALGPWRCDLAVQPVEGRRKRLLLADMDSTIISGESLDDLADKAGIGAQVASITARAMNGELDFAEALRARLALLAGQPATLVGEVLRGFSINPGAATLVATMRAHGADCLLISGGLDVFVEPVARALGFDGFRSNTLKIENGALTGRPGGPILDKHTKLQTLRETASDLGITPDQAATVGDGANDIPMLTAAGLGVAYRGKAAVVEAAPFRLDHADLAALLSFQGYRDAAFVAPARPVSFAEC